MAAEIRSLRERTDQLESMWHSAEERAARPPVLDEETLMAAVGEETAAILRAARAAANELRAKAAADGERIAAEAEERATAVRADAEAVLARETAAAHAAANQVVEAARSEAAQLVDRARAEGDSIRAAAQQERHLTIDGASATRERILEDLSRRRRVASVQIEQLRAGRERLIESYALVRRTLDEVQSELSRADTEARAAADAAGKRMQVEEPPVPADVAPPEAAEPDAGVEAGPTPEAATEPSTTAAGPAPATAVEPAPAADAPPPGSGRRGRGSREAVARAEADPAPEASAQSAAVPHLRVVPDPVEAAEHSGTVPETPASVPETPGTVAETPGTVAETPGTVAGTPANNVDRLFARIRAGRTEPPPAAETAAPQAEPAAAAEPAAVAEPSAGGAVDTPAADTPAADTPAADTPAADTEQGRSDADEALLQRREALVMDLEISLTRKLKRGLQDEQNDLLDRLRSLKVQPTAARLLPNLEEQTARYASAAQPLVDKAAAAGVAFAAEMQGKARAAKSSSPVVADLAREAASGIVDSLRRRLEQAISGADDDQQVLIEAIGNAYREWKSQRIERISGDTLAAAFSRGTWHHLPAGTLLRWVVEDVDGPCPDCDDDALAGSLPKGEAFPTGQPHPPAHSGCRCLLVPELA